MSERISLKGLDKGAVLAALFNASRPLGMGFMQYDLKPMTAEQGRELIEGGNADFDYLQGRVMKINLSGDDFDPRLYDRDNGQGAAAKAIEEMKASGAVDTPAIAHQHRVGTLDAAHQAEGRLYETSGRDLEDERVFNLGLGDHAGVLGPKIKEAKNKLRTQ